MNERPTACIRRGCNRLSISFGYVPSKSPDAMDAQVLALVNMRWRAASRPDSW